jgi:RNA polymerase sigma-70 factor (ECF subfamily)
MDAPPSPDLLQRRYLASVLNYVTARTGPGGYAEAEDIAAEVFAAAFASLARCPPLQAEGIPSDTTQDRDGDDPVRAWLFGIARRKVADSYRRRTRRPQTALSPGHPAPAGQGPEPRFLADEAARTLQTVLAKLPEMQREALLLRYIDELSLPEIGRILGKSPNAVAQLLHRARLTARTRGAAYFGTMPGFNNDEEVNR